MPLYYITGPAGSGKTTVIEELIRRGYEAHDIDDMADWFNEATGEFAPEDLGSTAAERDGIPDFYEKHSWKAHKGKIEELAKSANSKTIFLSGNMSNEEEFVHLANKVFALVIDDDTLRHRLTTRTNNDYGKNPVELQNELGWNIGSADRYAAAGYEVIDATQSLGVVIDKILSLTNEN
ncbi:AAA family ATPase [Candidatus Saccharibacteria bacterium]|nr:AAA family ATPase [Candidatus Saccharibacteria bacterium]